MSYNLHLFGPSLISSFPIPEDWKWKRFKYLSNIQKGRIADIDETKSAMSSLPYLSMEYLRGLSEPEYVRVDDKSLIAHENDILLLWDGANAGEFNKAKSGVVSSTLTKIFPYSINEEYLFYVLKASENFISAQNTGMGIPHVNGDFLMSLPIPIPSLDIQKVIVDFLNYETTHIDALILAKEKLLESLAEKRQALITRAVTRGLDPNVPLKDSGIPWLGNIPNHWEIKKLKYVSNIEISNVDKLSIEGQKTVRLCNYLDVYKNETIDSSIEFMISTATDEQIRRLSLRKGDVVLTKDSETPNDIGVPALIAEDFENLVCGYHLAIARPINNVIIGEYLQRVIQSNIIKAYYNIEAVGMTRYGLDKLSIANTPITVPPIKEQEGIIKELKKQFDFYRMISEKAKITIELLKERRSALITAAVTGKIEILDVA